MPPAANSWGTPEEWTVSNQFDYREVQKDINFPLCPFFCEFFALGSGYTAAIGHICAMLNCHLFSFSFWVLCLQLNPCYYFVHSLTVNKHFNSYFLHFLMTTKFISLLCLLENSNVEIAPTGTLILKHFNLSGAYNCSIVYKLTTMQLHRKHIIKYLIYGKLSIQVSALKKFYFLKCVLLFLNK